jgi:XTP/dITP diphosphohydrolase
MTTRLLLATRNRGKLAELRRMLEDAVPGVEVVGLADVEEYPEAPETGATFADNALLKAREAATYTGLPAVADDSGLTVDALNGMPGVLSARWSGRHGDDDANTALLLGQIADVPDERRGAAFVCAAALVTPDGTERVLERQWRGRVIREKRGTNGFGYDPVFVPDGLDAATAARRSRRWYR